MKKLILIIVFSLAACVALRATAPIDAVNVAPLWTIVLERYESLVEDADMTPEKKEAWLLDAELLRSILDAALGNELP